MKQLIILLLIIIALFIGYGKYQQYKRYNSPEVDYRTDKQIDLDYYNQDNVIEYHESIEDLNSFVMLQWSANKIDVRTPENDDIETKNAVKEYSKKLAKIKYFESKLENSFKLKKQGNSNKEIKYLVEKGIDLNTKLKEDSFNRIKKLFVSSNKMYYGKKSALIYEVQKQLLKKGYQITSDGIFKKETQQTIKKFEDDNNLFSDGVLDLLTLDKLFQ